MTPSNFPNVSIVFILGIHQFIITSSLRNSYLSCSFCSLDLFLFEVVELLNCAVGLDKNDVISVSFCSRISSSSDGISFANFGK